MHPIQIRFNLWDAAVRGQGLHKTAHRQRQRQEGGGASWQEVWRHQRRSAAAVSGGLFDPLARPPVATAAAAEAAAVAAAAAPDEAASHEGKHERDAHVSEVGSQEAACRGRHTGQQAATSQSTPVQTGTQPAHRGAPPVKYKASPTFVGDCPPHGPKLEIVHGVDAPVHSKGKHSQDGANQDGQQPLPCVCRWAGRRTVRWVGVRQAGRGASREATGQGGTQGGQGRGGRAGRAPAMA